jgi:hypothetical protein
MRDPHHDPFARPGDGAQSGRPDLTRLQQVELLARRLLKRVPGMLRLRDAVVHAGGWARETTLDAAERLHTLRLGIGGGRLPAVRGDPELIVSLTSFPARIEHVWITVETLLRQTVRPDAVILVLAEAQFPGREIPMRLVRQQARGLRILWVTEDTRSYKKLVPVRLAYPNATIVTVDDDARYAPWMLERLLAARSAHPRAVIGYRGWHARVAEGRLPPYIGWKRAGPSTPPGEALLTGLGGILYRPHLLPVELLTDMDRARRVCPIGDDLWFWAVAHSAGVHAVCLDMPSYQELRVQGQSPALWLLNKAAGENDRQLAAVIDELGLHERLGLPLPDQGDRR